VSDLRMNAYYYSFDETAEPSVNLVLSAVACAGKAFHNTESWNDADEANDDHEGGTPVEWIQNAANKAAAEVTQLRARIAELEKVLDETTDMFRRSTDESAATIADLREQVAEKELAIELREESWRANETSVLKLLAESETSVDQLTACIESCTGEFPETRSAAHKQLASLTAQVEALTAERDGLASEYASFAAGAIEYQAQEGGYSSVTVESLPDNEKVRAMTREWLRLGEYGELLSTSVMLEQP
jgi:predicted  nucleic acid-binding Zn-ribbon protein